MKRAIGYYFSLLIIFAVAKIFFMVFNPAVYSGYGFTDYLHVIGAGLAMDRSVAGYLTVPLMIILIIGEFCESKRGVNRALKTWYRVSAVILGLIYVSDTILYSYWGFKLDTTPLFYLTTSPSAAFASITGWQFAGAILILGLVTYGIYRFISLLSGEVKQPPYPVSTKTSLKRASVLALILGLLFIPIRGGVTVSTMNLSSAYFSSDTKLNHAAVNPCFSMLYSATHADNFASAFSYYPDDEAEKIVDAMLSAASGNADSLAIHTGSKPDVYLIILESFSSHLLPALGGEAVATGIDSIATAPGSILFSNIYASSFRTDRGLTAILSGFPAQPTTSVMKYVSKAETLPSVAAELNNAGYTSHYYYGGDANFTNMRAYLTSTGFSEIISDKDFPVSERLSKWGAHDDVLFDRVAEELTPYNPEEPKFLVIQTSSSHEPYEVPYKSMPDEPSPVTAFRFADEQVTKFVNTLRADSAAWTNSLIVLVPDHYGSWPKNLSEVEQHRIPLIFTGGAVGSGNRKVNTPGSQTDIAATLLGYLNLPADKFRYSRNLLSPAHPGFAFFSSRNTIALADSAGFAVMDLNTGNTIEAKGDTASRTRLAKAYLQSVYRDISKR